MLPRMKQIQDESEHTDTSFLNRATRRSSVSRVLPLMDLEFPDLG